MTTTVKEPSKSTFSKKEVRHQIALKLETALADLKTGMGEKKFKSSIKKASKLFSSHAALIGKKKSAAPSAKKATSPKKAATKKASKKAAAPSKKASPAAHA